MHRATALQERLDEILISHRHAAAGDQDVHTLLDGLVEEALQLPLRVAGDSEISHTCAGPLACRHKHCAVGVPDLAVLQRLAAGLHHLVSRRHQRHVRLREHLEGGGAHGGKQPHLRGAQQLPGGQHNVVRHDVAADGADVVPRLDGLLDGHTGDAVRARRQLLAQLHHHHGVRACGQRAAGGDVGDGTGRDLNRLGTGASPDLRNHWVLPRAVSGNHRVTVLH
mmetsp:Transcript_2004/g.5227  ORF Transcript_2004/g.5227 Transcript_2004/m.5227 type:complete len:224 (+) Transcript_2004:796-1467(+)